MPRAEPKASQLSVLAVFAHPDDEGFGSGGTLAMLVARGARVTLVCATNGDVGEISDPELATPETLPQVRQVELRQAMDITGIADVRFLGYRDSGMAGTPDNEHSDSLNKAEPERVVRQIVDIIREVRPHLLMTHDPTGAYGHPDHIVTYRHTKSAHAVAGDENFIGTGEPGTGEPGTGEPGTGEPWSTPLLYYVCFPKSVFRALWKKMVELDIEPPFARELADHIGSPDEEVTLTLDVKEYVDIKIASLDCHRTQSNSDGAFAKLPQDYLREIMSTEYFTLAAVSGPGDCEDLLANL